MIHWGIYVVNKCNSICWEKEVLLGLNNESGDMNMKKNDNKEGRIMFLVSFIGMIILLLLIYRSVGIFNSSETKVQGMVMSILLPTVLCLLILFIKKIIKK